jgi:hypothetical protein
VPFLAWVAGGALQRSFVDRGVRHVLVNGVHALRDGVTTGERGGRVLRR